MAESYKIGFFSISIEEHQEIIQDIKKWIKSNSNLEVIVEVFEIPLNKLRSNNNSNNNNLFSLINHDLNLIIIAHYDEGRLLLTDRNGLYDSLIHVAYQKTNGNILLLIKNENLNQFNEDDNIHIDSNIVKELQSCEQHLAYHLATQLRLFSCKNTLSSYQLSILIQHLTNQTNPLILDINLQNNSNGNSNHRRPSLTSNMNTPGSFCSLL